MTKTIHNFGQNLQFQPAARYRPKTILEVLEVLTQHKGQEIRAIGKLHSWSPAPTTSGVLIEMDQLCSIEIDRESDEVWVDVEAGCQIKQLVRYLDKHGLTLPSLGLIDQQTVSGATATGTHGSGKNSLSHYIESVSIAHYDEQTGDAQIAVVDQGPELKAARCSLGLMGVIVSLRFRCRPKYNIEEHAQLFETLDDVLALEQDYPQQQFYLMPWLWKFFGHHRVETQSPRGGWASLYRAYCFGIVDVGLHVVIYCMVKIFRSPSAIRFFYRSVLPKMIPQNWKVVDDSHAMLTMEHDLFRHIEIEIFVQRSDLERATEYVVDVMSVFGGSEMKNEEVTRPLLVQLGRNVELEELRGCYVHHYPICYRRVLPDATLMSMSSPGPRAEEDWYAISLISYQWPDERAGFFRFADFIGQTAADLFGVLPLGKIQPAPPRCKRAIVSGNRGIPINSTPF